MRKHILVGMTAILVLALATIAMAADPFVGTWKLNLAKSKYSPGPAPKSLTIKTDETDNGYKNVWDGLDAEGKANHLDYLSILDGKEHPYPNPNYDAYTATKVDSNTLVSMRKKGGKEAGTMRSTVSKDGKTMTITMKGKNAQGQNTDNTLVLDKQ